MDSFNQKESIQELIQKSMSTLLLEKNFNNIYVKDICSKAGISRSTFYDYYQDINDLMIKLEETMANKLYEIFLYKPISIKSDFIKYFKFVEENKNFYEAYFRHHYESNMIKTAFENYIKKISNSAATTAKQNLLYQQAFICGGLMSITNIWVTSGMKETPEQLNKIIQNEYCKDYPI